MQQMSRLHLREQSLRRARLEQVRLMPVNALRARLQRLARHRMHFVAARLQRLEAVMPDEPRSASEQDFLHSI